MNAKVLDSAQQKANSVRVPLTENRLGLADFVRKLGMELGDDHVGAFAASLTYRGLLAIFPFSIFLLAMLGVFHARGALQQMLGQLSAVLPGSATKLLQDQILAVTDPQAKGGFTIGAIIGVLIALWGISGAFRSVMEAMNVMYGVKETRGFVRRYAISIVISLVAAALFLAALTLVVAGPDIARALASHSGALGPAFVWFWKIVQWPVLLGLVLLAFALIYYVSPSAKQEFRFITVGSVFATVTWLLFSLLFSVYVSNFGSYNATYGTLAGVIVLMLYLYYSAFVMLIGAEVNAIVEEANPEGKDEGDKVPKDERGGGGRGQLVGAP